ncbi:MAG: GGDEF domain-containing protein [Lachnospiraceae bacterium]|nr:GGDEF domain-containing protein [Lachnospiraceae bacterium]
MSKKRPKIGVMVGNFHSDHPRRLVQQIYRLLHGQDVDVRFYLGTESSSFMDGFMMQGSKYDYQYASLYGYSRYDNLDLLIISEGTLGIYHDPEEKKKIFESLPDVPTIHLESIQEDKNQSYIIIDNYQGIRDCTEHLIMEHGCRDLAFLTGPAANRDADERLLAFLDTMAKHGLTVGENRIMHGDFSENVDGVIEDMFSKSPYPDAIVSANDEMATAVYRVMKRHGLTPGKEIKVTGFDDWEMAGFMDPPLTTARQDYEEIAEVSTKLAYDLLDGKEARQIRTKAPLIRRCSCGCCMDNVKDDTTIERQALIDSIWKQKKNQRNSWIGALLNRELLEASNTKNFYSRLGMIFQYLEVEKASIYLLEKPQYIEKGETIKMVPNVLRMLEYDKGKRKACSAEEALKVPLDNRGLAADRNKPASCAMVFLLFFEKYQYGTMHLFIDPEDIDFYYMLSLEIGSSMRYVALSLEQKASRQALKEKNQILDFTAHHDELTKVYNRTGVITKTLELFRRKSDTKFAVLMADLDHLKQINDTFGHGEGDFAIRSAAKILSEVMEKEDAVIGRTGGDEFVAIFSIRSSKDIRAYIQALHDKCREFNMTTDKPYYVEVSGGGVIFTAEEGRDLQNVLNRADELLYEDKKKRRESVIRK